MLGICVGMQVLFESGDEHGVRTDGCGEWPGTVDRLTAPVLPHMGWNTVTAAEGSTLFAGVEHERFYFVHSYAARSWQMRAGTDARVGRPAADLGGARRAVPRRGRERAALGDPVPPGEVRRRPERGCSPNWVRTLAA